MHNKISNSSIFAFSFFLSHFLFLFFAKNLISLSLTDTIYSFILGIIINLIILKFIPSFTIKKNKVINYISLFILIIFSIFLLFVIANFIHINFLPQGKTIYLVILLLILANLISKREIPQTASLAFISLVIFIIYFIFILIGSISAIDVYSIKPPLINNNFFISSLLFSFITLFPNILLAFIDKNNYKDPNKVRKIENLGIIAASFTILIETIMIAFLPTLSMASTYNYPFMLVVNKVSSFLIFDRFSYLFSIFLLLDSTIVLGLLAVIIKSLLPQKEKADT